MSWNWPNCSWVLVLWLDKPVWKDLLPEPAHGAIWRRSSRACPPLMFDQLRTKGLTRRSNLALPPHVTHLTESPCPPPNSQPCHVATLVCVTKEKTEAQRGQESCQRPQKRWWSKNLKLSLRDSKALAFLTKYYYVSWRQEGTCRLEHGLLCFVIVPGI